MCDNSIGKTQCTVGLHTKLVGPAQKFEVSGTRVEKCGQRGIMGRYCLHLHLAGDCEGCLLSKNAIEFGMQRGAVVHGTHRALVEHNVFNDVRGAGMYIEDGNEIDNRLE